MHSLSTSIVNLISALIILMNIELVELSSDMMCGTSINVPVGVYTIGTLLLLGSIIFIIITIAPPTVRSKVTLLLANLTENPFLPWRCNSILLAPFLPASLRALLVLARALLRLLLLRGSDRSVD
jgi:hypothetical protein